MSDLPSSITSRVQHVEDKISDIRARISALDAIVEADPEEAMRVLADITAQLQAMRTSVDDIRRLVRYR